VLTGNSGVNTLTGGAGNDSLNGGAGADTMVGGLGNDIYTVDNVGDVVTENANEGTDTVQSSISYTLGANVENLTLTGTTAINGTGNILDNVLTGNSGVNTLTGGAGNDSLNGGAGADTMVGGLGNDIYTVDNVGDVVTENASEGTDTVQSSITYTLGANVENLTLTGASAINGTGNILDNMLTGNGANNLLIGGAGNDTLAGGMGDDTYLFNLGDGIDTINNNDATGFDTVALGASISQASIALFRNNNNLEIGYSSGDKVCISDFFLDSNSTVDQVNLANGYHLSAADINQVIQDMSACAVNEGITMNSINDVQSNEHLMNLVVGSWHA
jgi:Ca2+-binding RTX toxin-like protein